MLLRLLAVCALTCAASWTHAEEKWHQASSENFLLVTNASEEQAESILETVEQFRFVLTQVLPELRLFTSTPTLIYGFRDRESLEPFLPRTESGGTMVRGYFRSSGAKSLIVIDLTGGAGAFERVLFHEYVHLMLSLGGRDLPIWFEEGLSEFYAGTRLGNERAELGPSDVRHLALMSRLPSIPLEDLLRAEAKDVSGPLFYAESWALVHYLLVARPEGGERLARFLSLSTTGADRLDAFHQAFGLPPSEMEEELRSYVKKGASSGFQIPLSRPGAPRAIPTRRLSRAEVQNRWGELFVANGHLAEARVCLEEALRLEPDLGAARETLGLLHLAAGKPELAREELERAILLDSASAAGLFEYAKLLLSDYPEDAVASVPEAVAEKAAAALRKSLSLEPAAREPAELLAFMHLVRGEKLDEAEALVATALAVSPNEPGLLFLQAQLLAKRGQYERAQGILRRVVQETKDPRLRVEVEAFLARMIEMQRVAR